MRGIGFAPVRGPPIGREPLSGGGDVAGDDDRFARPRLALGEGAQDGRQNGDIGDVLDRPGGERSNDGRFFIGRGHRLGDGVGGHRAGIRNALECNGATVFGGDELSSRHFSSPVQQLVRELFTIDWSFQFGFIPNLPLYIFQLAS